MPHLLQVTGECIDDGVDRFVRHRFVLVATARENYGAALRRLLEKRRAQRALSHPGPALYVNASGSAAVEGLAQFAKGGFAADQFDPHGLDGRGRGSTCQTIQDLRARWT